MRSVLAVASCAVMLLVPEAGAASYYACRVVTDPAGDVTGAAAAATATAHADIRTVTVALVSDGLIVWFQPEGAGRVEWHLTFTANGKTLFVNADRDGTVNAGTLGGYLAGVVGQTESQVTGSVGHDDRVRVDVPYRVFGPTAPKRGTALTGFHVSLYDGLFRYGERGQYSRVSTMRDEATSAKTVVVGRRC